MSSAATRPTIEQLDWNTHGANWPNAEHSRFVDAGGLRWHVQLQGAGPVVLLLHGAGAATHSWRGLAPELAGRFSVLGVDLPGHGFSQRGAAASLTLPGVARGLAGLCAGLGVEPELIVGHSAGAALGCHLALHQLLRPRALVSLNGAHLPLRGLPGWIYAPVAGLIADSKLLPSLFARRANRRSAVARVLASTGSQLDSEGFDCYWSLARCPTHVAAALGLMASWDVRPLERALPALQLPLLLITGANDRTVPPADSQHVAKLVANAEFVSQPGVGHLAHEELPAETAELIGAWYSRRAAAPRER